METPAPNVPVVQETAVDLDRLGDEIAELSAHLDAAISRLLELIRDFDERRGWNNGFRSCAAWLSWRIGLDPGAARQRVRVARALATPGTAASAASTLRMQPPQCMFSMASTVIATPRMPSPAAENRRAACNSPPPCGEGMGVGVT